MLLAVMLAAVASPAVAQRCPVMAGAAPSLADYDARARFAFIDGRLQVDQEQTRLFQLWWGLGFGATAVLQGSLAYWQPSGVVDDGWQVGLYVSAGKSLLATGSQFTRGVKVRRVQWDPADPCGAVARAERGLRATARQQRIRGGWGGQLEALTLNLAGLLVLTIGYDLWEEALVGAAAGMAVGQLRLYTFPRGASRALADYRAGALGGAETAEAATWQLVPMAAPGGYGLALHLSW